jgi:hypothetical protein
VCPEAFATAHCRGHSYYDKAIRVLKDGGKSSSINPFKNHCAIPPDQLNVLMKRGKEFGIKLSTAQFTQAALPGTMSALITAAWMKDFFEKTGNIIWRIC